MNVVSLMHVDLVQYVPTQLEVTNVSVLMDLMEMLTLLVVPILTNVQEVHVAEVQFVPTCLGVSVVLALPDLMVMHWTLVMVGSVICL